MTGGVPGFVGLFVGGRLAESRGRRPVAVVGVVLTSLATMAFFLAHGAVLWILGTIDLFVGAMIAPAMAAFGVELFPTEVRGTANAGLLVAGVTGSVIGLLLVGALADSVGLGPAIAWMGLAALVAGLLVLPRLPETGGRALDDVSPSEL